MYRCIAHSEETLKVKSLRFYAELRSQSGSLRLVSSKAIAEPSNRRAEKCRQRFIFNYTYLRFPPPSACLAEALPASGWTQGERGLNGKMGMLVPIS